jgi:hypothetical protein
MQKLIVSTLFAALSTCAYAQSYEQRAAGERLQEMILQIDKAGMDKARAVAALYAHRGVSYIYLQRKTRAARLDTQAQAEEARTQRQGAAIQRYNAQEDERLQRANDETVAALAQVVNNQGTQ